MRDWYTSQYLAQVHWYNSPHGMEEEEGVNTIPLMGWRRRKGLIQFHSWDREEGVNTIPLLGWRRRKGLIEQNEHVLTSTGGYTVHSTRYNLSYM